MLLVNFFFNIYGLISQNTEPICSWCIFGYSKKTKQNPIYLGKIVLRQKRAKKNEWKVEQVRLICHCTVQSQAFKDGWIEILCCGPCFWRNTPTNYTLQFQNTRLKVTLQAQGRLNKWHSFYHLVGRQCEVQSTKFMPQYIVYSMPHWPNACWWDVTMKGNG